MNVQKIARDVSDILAKTRQTGPFTSYLTKVVEVLTNTGVLSRASLEDQGNLMVDEWPGADQSLSIVRRSSFRGYHQVFNNKVRSLN